MDSRLSSELRKRAANLEKNAREACASFECPVRPGSRASSAGFGRGSSCSSSTVIRPAVTEMDTASVLGASPELRFFGPEGEHGTMWTEVRTRTGRGRERRGDHSLA